MMGRLMKCIVELCEFCCVVEGGNKMNDGIQLGIKFAPLMGSLVGPLTLMDK